MNVKTTLSVLFLLISFTANAGAAPDEWATRKLRAELPAEAEVRATTSMLGESTLEGTAFGDVEEVVDGARFRTRLCKGEVTSVTHSVTDSAVFAACGSTVYVREQEASVWEPIAADLPGKVRSLAADPFAAAVFVGTTEGTYRIEGAAIERVAGPSSDLRIVHFKTHTTVVGNFEGEVLSLAKTSGCTIGLYDLANRHNPTRTAFHYGYSARMSVRVNSENCRWSLDVRAASPWLRFRHPGGPVWKRAVIDQLGSNDIEVLVDRNDGYARTGTFTVYVGNSKVKSSVTQLHRTGVCMHTPRSTDNTSAAYLAEGEFVFLYRYFGKIVPGLSGKGPRVNFVMSDASRCHAEPIVSAVTPPLAGSDVTAVGQRAPAPTVVVVSTPFPPANEKGELLVTTLRGNGGVGPSAVVTVLLKDLAELPLDLRNSGPGKPGFVAFDTAGGRFDLEGTVSRQTKDPNRRCAFDPALYRVVAGNWLTISAKDSGCNSKSPDLGKLAILAQPNAIGTRYGAIVTPWGYTLLVVQR